ncbi:hypothetical protein [Aciditerrimonas ferrireducens]|uniref:hypothetical protein n=1 Tax=Aciditerrimonas ferrireducens TaxID=667306 RepID=UPI0020046659|nr:hypothetical protein [Aciditerrimonas ferrireducens]MCK4176736.1 hypothetical protein [Aciditerrimonas ferrireducens]
MIKLALGVAIGFLLGAKLGEAGLEDVLQIAQQTLASDQVADLVRTGAAALGDAVRMLGVALTEEVPARLAERPGVHELAA